MNFGGGDTSIAMKITPLNNKCSVGLIGSVRE
jgi:hypothetical protein